MRFEISSKNKSEIERDARLIVDEIFENKSVLPSGLRRCYCSAFARDCLFVYAEKNAEVKIKNFFAIENTKKIESCADISKKRDEAEKLSSKLVKYSTPKGAVDCTADADLSAFAGVPFEQGTGRSGISINYSRWNRKVLGANVEKKKDVIAKDYGIVDVTKVSDFQRAMLVAHYESNFFDTYPQLTPREARRPVGMKTLTLRDALEGESAPDIIAQAFTDYAPHNYPTGKFSRCAHLLTKNCRIFTAKILRLTPRRG